MGLYLLCEKYDVYYMNCFFQVSWVIKNIFATRKFLYFFGSWKGVEKKGGFFVSSVYKKIRGDFEKVFWKNIICCNKSFLKTVFIIWMVLWGKLRIKIL